MTARGRRVALAGAAVLGVTAVAGAPLTARPVVPDDPFYASRGSWGQAHDDQWALKRVGFAPTGQGLTAWERAAAATHPVIVAVIDSGLDYFHPDLRRESVWRNPGEIANGRDDDGNGFVDDLVGWNFADNDNNPWDSLGHGTHVAGIIAAATRNGEGIAGVNPAARIMPLKVTGPRGRTDNAAITAAIFYAVRHGARVINLSLGGVRLSRAEEMAIEHAHARGVVVVVAAGNQARDVAAHGPAGVERAIAVAATDVEDRRVGYSNWGRAVKIAAPGVDILSLRARGTDFNFATRVKDYTAGSAIVGAEGRYYRASGTSFAAPFVSGAAALLLSANPALTSTQVERMLLMSADDVDVPGWDRHTGAGRLNVARALAADPDWFLHANVTDVRPAREGGQVVVQVHGTVAGSALAGYRLELARGEAPDAWTPVGPERTGPVEDGLLGTIPIREITARGKWTIRVVARDAAGNQREGRGTLTVQ